MYAGTLYYIVFLKWRKKLYSPGITSSAKVFVNTSMFRTLQSSFSNSGKNTTVHNAGSVEHRPETSRKKDGNIDDEDGISRGTSVVEENWNPPPQQQQQASYTWPIMLQSEPFYIPSSSAPEVAPSAFPTAMTSAVASLENIAAIDHHIPTSFPPITTTSQIEPPTVASDAFWEQSSSLNVDNHSPQSQHNRANIYHAPNQWPFQ